MSRRGRPNPEPAAAGRRPGGRGGRLRSCSRTLLAAGWLAAATGALAGGFHSTLRCSDCHSAKGPGFAYREGAGVDVAEPCLACHDDGGRGPDVMHEDRRAWRSGPAVPAAPRPAGGLNAVGDGDGAANGGWAEISGHTLGSPLRPPGEEGGWPGEPVLMCKSCHAPHANGMFRNLRRDLFLRGGALEARLRDPDGGVGTSSAMNAFCAGCHATFHGAEHTLAAGVGGARSYVRHPTSEVPVPQRIRELLAASAEPLRVGRNDEGEPEVACVTCHRAHGTKNPFGLIHWDPAAAANGEDGAGDGPESLCRTCHDVDRPQVSRR